MKRLIVVFLTLLLSGSCLKLDPPPLEYCGNGYIYWGGDPAVDGRGWYFAITRSANYTFYQLKENELGAEYKSLTDSVAVNICLLSTKDKAPCMRCNGDSYYFKIKSISRR
jgi:hypothetical protein